MLNTVELRKSIESMKREYAEAVLKGNNIFAKKMIDEIVRLEVITSEENIKKNLDMLEQSKNAEIEFDMMEEESLCQEEIERKFSNQLGKIYQQKKNSTNVLLTETQKKTIIAGITDRIGMDINDKQMEFINNLNKNQASGIIRLLSGISFYNQRAMLTKSIEILKNREDFAMILHEIKLNIHQKAWFDANEDLLRMSRELQEPTEAQVRRIADVAKYTETHYTLKNEFGIDVEDFEYRPEGKLYYIFNWRALNEEIKNKFNRESASNFIQTYDYISNLHEGTKLDKDQMNDLKSRYIQLGEYEKTRMTYLMTITKDYYDYIIKDLDERVRLNKIAQNLKDSRVREAMKQNPLIKKSKYARETRSIVLKQEQEEAKEMCDFIFGIYSCVGQEVPEEMNKLLPYFIQRGETVYANVEEQHYAEFRKLVFEQRQIIREVDPSFNWGAMIANQPMHILKALGLDMMM